MRALAVAVAVLMSAVASAQQLKRPPPPGQPTGPIQQPAPTAPVYNGGPVYEEEEEEGPEAFRHRKGALVVVEREQMLARLARMEEMLERAMERGGRSQRYALRKLGDELDALRYDLKNARELRNRQPRPPPPAPPPVPAVQPITEVQLEQLMRAIGRESFGDAKLRVLGSAAPTQYFLVPQVLKVLKRFSFGDDKLEAMRLLWPRVLDRENAYHLYGAFTFQGEKEELRRILGG